MQILNRLNLNLDSFCMSQFLFPIHLSSLISKSIYLPTWGFAFLSFFSLRTPFCSKPSFSCHTSITLSTLFASFFYSLFPLQPIFLPALIHFKIPPPHSPDSTLPVWYSKPLYHNFYSSKSPESRQQGIEIVFFRCA